jgi:hypothetical protein
MEDTPAYFMACLFIGKACELCGGQISKEDGSMLGWFSADIFLNVANSQIYWIRTLVSTEI